MNPKTFTLEEANKMVPFLNQAFDRVHYLNKRLNAASRDVQDLFDIWGNDILNKKNVDHSLYLERRKIRDALIQELQFQINNIQSLGCFVKDASKGLVDFLHETNGETVYLCWKYGENEVNHWHPITSGYAARRHIDDIQEDIENKSKEKATEMNEMRKEKSRQTPYRRYSRGY